MRVVIHGSLATQPGDRYLTEYGEWRELVAIESAGVALKKLRLKVPRHSLRSTTGIGTAMKYGDRTGRERQQRDAEVKRLNKPVRPADHGASS